MHQETAMNKPFIDQATRDLIAKWLAMHGGDAEALARWMTTLPGARFSRKTSRELIQQALS
jgi:hypothetical protein